MAHQEYQKIPLDSRCTRSTSLSSTDESKMTASCVPRKIWRKNLGKNMSPKAQAFCIDSLLSDIQVTPTGRQGVGDHSNQVSCYSCVYWLKLQFPEGAMTAELCKCGFVIFKDSVILLSGNRATNYCTPSHNPINYSYVLDWLNGNHAFATLGCHGHSNKTVTDLKSGVWVVTELAFQSEPLLILICYNFHPWRQSKLVHVSCFNFYCNFFHFHHNFPHGKIMASWLKKPLFT